MYPTRITVPPVIYTQHVTAEHLHEMRGHLPWTMFISDGDERVDPNGGWRTVLSRMVSGTSEVRDGDGHRIVVNFADGPDTRTFSLDEIVEVHIIRPDKTTP